MTRCGYCTNGWAPGCGDQTCCPPGPCQSCDGTGIRKNLPGPTRVALTVTVSLDRSGYGAFSTPESARECVEAILKGSIEHYDPVVTEWHPA